MTYRGMIATEGARYSASTIALEDEEVAQAEAQELAAEIPADLADAERSIDVAEGLQSVAEVADTIESPQATDIALVQTAADLAVAGSDVPPEEVIPVAGEALESAIGHRIATESIKETAMAIYERVKAFVKRIWEKIEAFWHKYFGTLPRLKRKIEALRKVVDSAVGKKVESDGKKFELTSGLKALSVDYKAVKNGADLKKELNNLLTVAQAVYVEGSKGAADLGKQLAKEIGDIEEGSITQKAAAAISTFQLGFAKMDLRNVAKKDVSSKYGSGYDVKESDSLLGSVKILSKKGETKTGGMLANLEKARKSGVSLIAAGDRDKEVDAVDFETLTPSDADALLSTLDKLVDVVENYERSATYKEVKKAREELDKASSKAAAKVGKLKATEGGTTAEDIAIFRSCLNFNVSYTNWTTSVQVGLSSRVVTTAGAIMSVIAKSMSKYK